MNPINYELELTKLYNTLLTIETRGQHTKTMADCLKFTEGLIAQTREVAVSGETESKDSE